MTPHLGGRSPEEGTCSPVASAADPRVTLGEPLPSRAVSGSLLSLGRWQGGWRQASFQATGRTSQCIQHPFNFTFCMVFFFFLFLFFFGQNQLTFLFPL